MFDNILPLRKSPKRNDIISHILYTIDKISILNFKKNSPVQMNQTMSLRTQHTL